VTPTLLLTDVIAVSLTLYALLAGADYGAGVWDLLSSGPLKENQKELIANAIRPIWEANHVWLILILVLMFSGFPKAFGVIMVALFIPILLMLLGIVLRGSSFVFRAYSTADSRMQRTWAYVFSAASCFTPFFLGVVLGSLSAGHVVVVDDASVNGYVLTWLNPFPIAVGMFTLVLFAHLAAAYLTLEAPTQQLRESFRNRAIGAGLIAGCLEVLAFMLAAWYARDLRDTLLHNALARGAVIAAAIALITGVVALHKDRLRLARMMAVAHTSAVAIGWSAAQYPYIVRPDITIFNSVSSDITVRYVVLAALAGAFVLFPSLALLLFVFKDQRKQSRPIVMPPAPTFVKMSPTQPLD
jgi:cytochrome bd ubiquinol oxidase subunit II